MFGADQSCTDVLAYNGKSLSGSYDDVASPEIIEIHIHFTAARPLLQSGPAPAQSHYRVRTAA